MPSISVIIPAFNASDYIPSLLKDLSRQTFDDAEFLVVDDGSTDNTLQLLRQHASQDPRFIIHSIKNSGPSVARNHAIERARGQYLAFADADDRVSPNFLETMYASSIKNDADMVCCGAQRLEGYVTRPSPLHHRAIVENRDSTHINRQPELVWDTTVWNKLIRRRLWVDNGIRFEPGRVLNDILPSLQCHVLADTVNVVTDKLYFWRARTDLGSSITDSKFTDSAARLRSLTDRAHALTQAHDLLKSRRHGSALEAFYYRLLWHDLAIYLPFYALSDGSARRELTEICTKLLQSFQIAPERYAIGPQLQQTYRAMLEENHPALGRLLSDDYQLVPRIIGGWCFYGGQNWLQELLRGPVKALAAEARVDGIRSGEGDAGFMLVTGVLRVRDGRSDIAADWRSRLVLVSNGRLKKRLLGDFAELQLQPDHGIHPLRRSGWRPFELSIDVSALCLKASGGSWSLGLEVVHKGCALNAQVLPTQVLKRHLHPGWELRPGAAAVPVVDGGDEIKVMLDRYSARVNQAELLPDLSGVRLSVSKAPVNDTNQVVIWAESSAGEKTDAAPVVDDQVDITFPDGLKKESPRWEFWCSDGTRSSRLRIADGFSALKTLSQQNLSEDGMEWCARPTVRGRFIVECLPVQVDLGGFKAGPEPHLVELTGYGVLPEGESHEFRLHCQWSDETRRFKLIKTGQLEWRAVVAVTGLSGKPDSHLPSRGWQMRIASNNDPIENAVPVKLPVAMRPEFPKSVTTSEGAITVEAGAQGNLVLWFERSDLVGRWPNMVKFGLLESRKSG